MTPGLLPGDPGERDPGERAWAFILASGHADCGGWTHDSRDPDGWLTCACGEAVQVPARQERPGLLRHEDVPGPHACRRCGATTGPHLPDLVLVGTADGWECGSSACAAAHAERIADLERTELGGDA